MSMIADQGIDLHFHSTASDGALAPSVVIELACKRGAHTVALTDHDCLFGQVEAQTKAKELGLNYYNGVEISVSWGSHTLHIVGLGVALDSEVLQEGLTSIRSGRIERAREMGASLAARGIESAFEGAMKYASRPEMISRTHFARYLVEVGAAKDTRQVFKRYLAKGKPGYVPHHWTTLEEALAWIHHAKGMAIIAHPGRYELGRNLTEKLLNEFVEFGGQGIEVVSGSHSLDETHRYALLANKFGLFAGAGSDFHAPGEGGRGVGLTASLPPLCKPVWTALAANIQGDETLRQASWAQLNEPTELITE